MNGPWTEEERIIQNNLDSEAWTRDDRSAVNKHRLKRKA